MKTRQELKNAGWGKLTMKSIYGTLMQGPFDHHFNVTFTNRETDEVIKLNSVRSISIKYHTSSVVYKDVRKRAWIALAEKLEERTLAEAEAHADRETLTIDFGNLLEYQSRLTRALEGRDFCDRDSRINLIDEILAGKFSA